MNLNKIAHYILLFVLYVTAFSNFTTKFIFGNTNNSFLNICIDVIIIIICIYLLSKVKNNIIFYFFIILITFSFIINEGNITTFTNGFREFSSFFLLPIIYKYLFYSLNCKKIIKSFNTFLYTFLSIQIPISIFQYLQYGAGDAVGGSLGAGFSGVLTFTIFLSTFYLMTQNFDPNNVIKCFLKKSYLLIFWIPTFINETKISFILIILFFILLNKIKIKNIFRYAALSITLIPLVVAFDTAYEKTTGNSYLNGILTEDFIEDYLLNDDDKYDDIPRFRKIIIFTTTFDFKDVMIGKGLGHFKGGTTLDPTPFAAKYQWLLAGSRPMIFFLLVQVGVIGTLLFILYWTILVIPKNSKKQRVEYSSNLIAYATICFTIIMLYNDSLRSLFFCSILMYIITYATLPVEPAKIASLKLLLNKRSTNNI